MKIVLFDVQFRATAINKTNAGGYGTSSKFSESKNPLVQALIKAKKKGVVIPLPVFGYLTKIFRDQGHEVSITHGREIEKADIFILYGSLVEYSNEIEIAKLIKSLHPEAKIGFIGLFPSVRDDLFIEHADFVIKGEAEYYFLNNAINDKFKGVLGPEELEDLNALPFPDWNGFDENKFRHSPFFGDNFVYPVQFTRGCPFSCAYYCAYPILGGKKTKQREVDNMFDELLYLKQKYNAKAILFRDPTFSLRRQTTVDLCSKIIEADLDIKWAIETHPQQLDRELLNMMKKAGLVAITIGVESRTPKVLKSSHRKDTEESHLTNIVQYSEDIGISIMAGYIFGQMDDTTDSIEATIKYAKELNTSFAQFVISTPYPGTSFYEEIKNLITTSDWTKYDTYTSVFEHPNLSVEELEALKTKAFISYYFRLKWLFKGKFLKKIIFS